MLTCIARPKKPGGDSEESVDSADRPKQPAAVKYLTSQFKGYGLKASRAYRHCNPCTVGSAGNFKTQNGGGGGSESDADSERMRWSYRSASAPRVWGKEMELRLKGISSSSGEGTPSSAGSGGGVGGSMRKRVEQLQRQQPEIVFVEEREPKEWVAQVEHGVLITFVSLPRGGNDLKRIRFSLEMFNNWKAQRWWAENYDRVMELYNVQRLNRQAFPLPTRPRSEEESSKMESVEASPVTPPLSKERLPRNLYRPTGTAMRYSSSDSFDQQSMHSRHNYDSTGISSTPKLSSISGAKTEISSMDASKSSSSSRDADRSGELSISTASDLETEWVEQDEPGVYITIRALPGGKRELRRVRFSREKFGEMHAKVWWDENRARVYQTYL